LWACGEAWEQETQSLSSTSGTLTYDKHWPCHHGETNLVESSERKLVSHSFHRHGNCSIISTLTDRRNTRKQRSYILSPFTHSTTMNKFPSNKRASQLSSWRIVLLLFFFFTAITAANEDAYYFRPDDSVIHSHYGCRGFFGIGTEHGLAPDVCSEAHYLCRQYGCPPSCGK
jgi:hypothetical protein